MLSGTLRRECKLRVVCVGEWSYMCVRDIHRDEDTAQAWGMVSDRYSEVRGGAMRVAVRSASLGGLRLATLVHRFASRLCSCQEHHGSGRGCEARGMRLYVDGGGWL